MSSSLMIVLLIGMLIGFVVGSVLEAIRQQQHFLDFQKRAIACLDKIAEKAKQKSV